MKNGGIHVPTVSMQTVNTESKPLCKAVIVPTCPLFFKESTFE